MQEEFMQLAIELAKNKMEANEGGPFGAVIVKNGEVIATGWNQVTSTNDPTAHAEVVAIRAACKKLDSFQLHDCEIYTSCEPCPMCFGAIGWARPKAVYFAATREDAAQAGFDDEMLYEELKKAFGSRDLPYRQLMREKALKVFESWNRKPDKVEY